MSTETMKIAARFHGFPGVGHGGYVSGLLSERVPGPLEVRLLEPPPLEVPLTITVTRDGASLSEGDRVIAEARPTNLQVDLPASPTLEEASAALASDGDPADRPSWTCLTCGPARAPGDGLRVFVAPCGGIAAGDWVAHPNFAGGDGALRTRFTWAALDCPSYWGIFGASSEPGRAVTAKLSCQVLSPVPVDTPLVVIGWPIADRGRLLRGGSAILSPRGEPLAVAEATWLRSGAP